MTNSNPRVFNLIVPSRSFWGFDAGKTLTECVDAARAFGHVVVQTSDDIFLNDFEDMNTFPAVVYNVEDERVVAVEVPSPNA